MDSLSVPRLEVLLVPSPQRGSVKEAMKVRYYTSLQTRPSIIGFNHLACSADILILQCSQYSITETWYFTHFQKLPKSMT